MSLRRFRNPRNAFAPTASTARARDPRRQGGSRLGSGAASNAAAVKAVDYRAPAPLADATVRGIGNLYLLTASGRAAAYSARWGVLVNRYTGYAETPQRFYGAQGVGNTASIRLTTTRDGLPTAAGLAGQAPTPMQLLLASNDAMTNGLST